MRLQHRLVHLRELVLGLAVALAGCGQDFTSDSQPVLAVDPVAAFPSFLPHTDSSALEVRITDPGHEAVAGATVRWGSSDSTILAIVQDTAPTGSDSFQVAAAGLHATLIAKGRGAATISVAVSGGGGGAAVTEYQTTITVLERWIAVGAGATHSCAIAVDGAAYCWGSAELLGNGTGASAIPVAVTGLADIKLDQISTGETTTCAREIGGSIYCWGKNLHGEVGDGTLNPSFHPTLGGSALTFSSISAGGDHVCGVSSTLGIGYPSICWGVTSFGQLGESRLSPKTPCDFFFDVVGRSPTRECTLQPTNHVIFLEGEDVLIPVSLSSGGLHNCAVGRTYYSDQNGIICWGLATVGQTGEDEVVWGGPFLCTGDAYFYSYTLPCLPSGFPVNTTALFTSVSAGWNDNFEAHTCGIQADSLASCWGKNDRGQLGTTYVDVDPCEWSAGSTNPGIPHGSPPCSRFPTPVQSNVRFTSIGAGARGTCALGALDSLIYCWGDNSSGQLGDGSSAGSRVQPAAIDQTDPAEFAALSVGAFHSCGIRASDGAIFCWGRGNDGQLGDGAVASRRRPVRVTGPL